MDIDRLISGRARAVDASGIRRVFELGAKLKDPINLSIGQPDFPVPAVVKRAAIDAIERDQNGYTMTQGIPSLRTACSRHVAHDLGWPDASAAGPEGPTLIVTGGTSGGLYLAMMAILGDGDELIIPDPYFVAYPQMAALTGGRAVLCDTYPDGRMTAERIAPLIGPRTKAVLLNSPANPTGVVLTQRECRDVLELCRSKNVLLISDEIYDEFCFDDAREAFPAGRRCPSPCREPGSERDVLLIRGFGKTYGCTGWRLGYAAGPPAIITQMIKLQQYTYVCAPSPLQHGCAETFGVSMERELRQYSARRDMVLETLGKVTEVFRPGGAFYAYVKTPAGETGQQFFERALAKNVLVIPGNVFSKRDTHFRISFATRPESLERGVSILRELMR